MSEERVLQIAQGPVMWLISLCTVAFVVVQTVLIYRKTKKYAEEQNLLTKDEMKSAVRSGAITTIGPAISIFILGLTMVSLLGAPITLMRIGIIGSAQTEVTAASIGAMLAGVNLGSDPLTIQALTAATFAMAVMSMGYLIFVPLLARGLGKGVQKILYPEASGGKKNFLSIFFVKIFPVIFVLMLALSQVSNGVDYVVSMLASAVVMVLCSTIAQKKNIKWLREWNIAFAVLTGLIVGPLAGMIF